MIRYGRLALALLLLVTGCQRQTPPPGSPVAASSVMQDLHLSTAVPNGPQAFPRSAAPAILNEPVILRKMQPSFAGGGKRAAGEAGTISLNFEKASLRSVIDAVLGDALGVPYSVDERVDGVVTLVSPQKLGREEALEVLDGVLRLNGATLIKGDNLYRVVLTANARQNLPGPKIGTDQPGFGISVYAASHTAATSLQKLIEPLYQISGAIAADSDHNLLLVTGSAEERRALIEAAKLFDQDWLAAQSVGIFPLHHAHPRALADELRTLFGPGGAASNENVSLRVSVIDRLNAVMIVSRQASGLDSAAEWVARLDQIGAGERTLHVYSVHYAKPTELAKLLTRLLASQGGTETGNAALPPGIAGAKISTMGIANASPAQGNVAGVAAMPPGVGASGAAGSGGSSGFGSSDKPLGGSNGESDNDSLGDTGGSGVKIVADSASHSLMVLANQQEAQTIETALARLDARPVQILIEATIVEVTLNKTLQYGVQYYLRGSNLLGNKTGGSLNFNSTSTGGTIAGSYPGFNGVIGTLSSPSVILSALDAVTNAKVLSSPQLMVTDSHEALLKVGTQVPLLTQQAVSTLTTGAPTVSSVEYHDTGVILRVLPRSNDADMVSLDIAQEVSAIVANATNSLTPNIDERRIESSVTVQSGQTVMLGGLISENNSQGHNSLPGLGDVPVLAGLFGNVTDVRDRTELIIFLTPHVLRDGLDAERLTEELMGRLTSMRPREP